MYFIYTISYKGICINIPIDIYILLLLFSGDPQLIQEKIFVLYYFEYFAFQVYLCVSFLSGAFWNHVTHSYTDAVPRKC